MSARSFRPTSPEFREEPRQLNPPDARSEWKSGAAHDGGRLFSITVLHGESNEEFGLQGAAPPPLSTIDVLGERLDAAEQEQYHPQDPRPCERINLTCMSLDEGCCAVLAYRLPALAIGLLSLNLHGCGIGNSGCSVLSAALSSLLHLESVYLGQCAIGDGGVAALAPALGKMRALKDIVLFGNDIHDGGAAVLAAKISGLPKLRTLDLTGCPLGADGTLALGRAMIAADRVDVDCFSGLNWRVCAGALGAALDFASDAHLYAHLFPESGVRGAGDAIASPTKVAPRRAAAQKRDDEIDGEVVSPGRIL
jgi:hypothetical protein